MIRRRRTAAEAALRVVAVAGGATGNGNAEVFAEYHAGLVPPERRNAFFRRY